MLTSAFACGYLAAKRPDRECSHRGPRQHQIVGYRYLEGTDGVHLAVCSPACVRALLFEGLVTPSVPWDTDAETETCTHCTWCGTQIGARLVCPLHDEFGCPYELWELAFRRHWFELVGQWPTGQEYDLAATQMDETPSLDAATLARLLHQRLA